MTVDLATIERASNTARPVLQEYVTDLLAEYDKLWQEKTHGDQKPAIMLYGMYSHGKSTLLNALLGYEAAEIGKPPTTDSVTEYEWKNGDCIIIDTPGIQAKVGDTKVSQKRLETCELVAFVVQSGQYEEHLVWDTLARMVAQGQKVCLIINDFDQCKDNPELSERLYDEFRKRLQAAAEQISYRGNIVKDVSFLIVNAKTALKAKLNNKIELLQHSGLLEVERALANLAKSLNLTDSINTLRRALLKLIADCNGKLAAESGDNLLAEAEEQLSAIQDERERAYTEISLTLDSKIALLGPQLHQLYESGGNDKNAMQQALSRLVGNLLTEMTDVVKSETRHSAKRIQELCAEFDRIRIHLAPEDIHIEEGDATPHPDLMDSLSKIDWTPILKGMNWEEAVQGAVVTVMTKLKDLFPDLLFGKGAATFGRWGGYVAGALGAVISVLLFCFNFIAKIKLKKRQESERNVRHRLSSMLFPPHNSVLKS